MCRTIESSLFTLIFTILVSSYLFHKKPFVSKILFLLGIMQLIDLILWHSIKTKNLKLNKIVSTYIIPLVFFFQIIGVYYSSLWRNKYFEFCFVFLLSLFMWIKKCKITIPAKDGYLKWCDFRIPDISRVIYILMIIYPILKSLPNGLDKDIIIMSLLTTFIYNYNNEAFGSKWCYSANIMSLLLLINTTMLEIN